MKYFIRFVGHVIQQPGIELPHEIYYDVISDFEKEDLDPQPDGKMGLKQFCNVVTFQLMEHGMVVPKNPGRTQDGTKVRFEQRMGVGAHMIGYISLIVKPLEEPRPVLPEMAMFETGETVDIFPKESVN